MALMRRRPSERSDTGAKPGDEGDGEGGEGGDRPGVEVTIDGPDAQRLAGLVDTSVLADVLRRHRPAGDEGPAKAADGTGGSGDSGEGGATPRG